MAWDLRNIGFFVFDTPNGCHWVVVNTQDYLDDSVVTIPKEFGRQLQNGKEGFSNVVLTSGSATFGYV